MMCRINVSVSYMLGPHKSRIMDIGCLSMSSETGITGIKVAMSFQIYDRDMNDNDRMKTASLPIIKVRVTRSE